MARGCIAVIPARGGSKGIPRKNVRPLGGVPLIAHTIRAARQASCIDRVLVSTEDGEIAAIARRYGAEVIERPPELASDEASSEAALLHALESIERTTGELPEFMAFLQCTSPLTTADHIDGTFAALEQQHADTAFTVARFHGFLWEPAADGDARPILHEKTRRLRRQERSPQFQETGAVYFMRVAGFQRARHRFFGKTAMHVVPPDTTLEIDEPEDFVLAEMRLQAKAPRMGVLPTPLDALVMDFDGVFTDNRVWVDANGLESVVCNRGDGMGLARLRDLGIQLLVLSKERNPVVTARCDKLGIACLQGIDDKQPALERWLAEQDCRAENVVYIGNDINDLECLQVVGCGVVVADAHPKAKAVAQLVLRTPGGMGALRELADMIEDHVEALRCNDRPRDAAGF